MNSEARKIVLHSIHKTLLFFLTDIWHSCHKNIYVSQESIFSYFKHIELTIFIMLSE